MKPLIFFEDPFFSEALSFSLLSLCVNPALISGCVECYTYRLQSSIIHVSEGHDSWIHIHPCSKRRQYPHGFSHWNCDETSRWRSMTWVDLRWRCYFVGEISFANWWTRNSEDGDDQRLRQQIWPWSSFNESSQLQQRYNPQHVPGECAQAKLDSIFCIWLHIYPPITRKRWKRCNKLA